MFKRAFFAVVITLLLTSMIMLVFNVRPITAGVQTVYINADGSITPAGAPIVTSDKITYNLTASISYPTYNGIVVQRSNIIIDGEGYTVQGNQSGNGLYLQGRNGVTIKNTKIKSFAVGIQLLGSCTYNSVVGNEITSNNGPGISAAAYPMDWNNISGNNITANNGYGIVLVQASSNSISGNNITANQGGIKFGGSGYNSIVGNTISSNNGNGIYSDYGSIGNSVSGNSITNNSEGIYLDGANGNSISGNAITTNNGDGIYLRSRYSSIAGNSIINNHCGISLEALTSSGERNSMTGNNITNNYYGVYLSNRLPSSYDNVSENTLKDNVYGIYLDSHYYTSSIYDCINGNTFIDCGLVVQGSIQNTVANNTVNGKPLVYLEGVASYSVGDAGQVILVSCDSIKVQSLNLSNATVGLQLWQTSNSVISGNNITANSYYGLLLGSSSNNRIYHNNFNNTSQAFNNQSTSFWDDGYPSGGNYWSSYAGNDNYSGPYQNVSGSDGVGDSAYVIDPSNIDNYPLMGPYVPFENQTICIKVDGSIDPSGAPILRKGDFYSLTADVISNTDGIVIERDNVTLDGTGCMLQGAGGGRGIDLSFRTNVTVQNTHITAFDYGVWLDYSSCNAVCGNNITANHNYGVSLQDSSRSNTISANNIAHTFGTDIYIYSSDNNTIYGNNITTSDGGFYIVSSSDIKVFANNVTDNYYGVWLDSSSSNTVYGNSMTNNDGYGVILYRGSCNNTIYGNNITNSGYDGVWIYYGSDNNTIYENNVANNGYGAFVESLAGISSSNNVFYHNNFVENTVQAYALNGVANVWNSDYLSGGNYWSDYAGVDFLRGVYKNETGSDGIGDAPYVIDANNTDHYPLMKPYAGPHDIGIVSLSREKTVVCQGYSANMTLKTINYGEQQEIFNVTIMSNSTPMCRETITLAARDSATVDFTWNTSGLARGNYSLSAHAQPVEGETDTTDNNCTGEWLTVSMIGDLNGGGPTIWDFVPDGKCNILDVVVTAKCFGSYPGCALPLIWNANCDVTGLTKGVPDDKVNILDIQLVAQHFGEHSP